jgi:Spy/CpxP family protein refolding chaperone
MRMLTTVVMSLVVALGATAILAADTAPTSQPGHRGDRMGRMGKFLDLTDQQKAQIKDIMTKAREDAKSATTPEAKKAIFKAAHEKIRKDVLTAEQVQKLEKARHGMAMRHAFAQLNLTDDQKAKIKDIMKQARTDMQNAKDAQAKKAVMTAARDKIRTDVLTDAQRKQLDDMKAKAGARHGGKHGAPTTEKTTT